MNGSHVAGLLEAFPDEWRAATRHPFLEAVRQGSLPEQAFASWLVQDYLFVGDLLMFQARLLARAPRPAQRVLVGGLVALEAELAWFEEHASQRGLELARARHPTTAGYREFLLALDEAAYAAASTGLWALERAYLEAWTSAAPGGDAYAEFVEHWTAPAFEEYVAGLAAAADRALEQATADERASARNAFLEVARLEREFWAIGTA